MEVENKPNKDTVREEIRNILSRLESYGIIDEEDPQMVDAYNTMLRNLQRVCPDNHSIQRKLQITQLRLSTDPSITNEVHGNCSHFLELLSAPSTNPQGNTNNITINQLQGNFSFENIISQVQQTNTTHQTVIINKINELKDELNKPVPDKDKLKNILKSIPEVGNGVTTGLLVEVAKKLLGL